MEAPYPVLPLSARVAPAISRLALDTFARFIGPEYSFDGREAFRRYATQEAVRFRLESGEVAFGAFDGPELVGVLEMRGISHVALLFVDFRHHRRGVARALLSTAIVWAQQQEPTLEELTLNSSPYARPAYERMGFVPTGPESELHGVRSTPMALPLRQPD